MKFAIGVLLALGLASVLAVVFGEFFPASVPGGEQFYLSRMGAGKFNMLKFLGVFNPYRSFWYIGLLTILSLSMTVCTYKQMKSMWRLAFGKSFKETKEEIKKYSNAQTVSLQKESRNIQENLIALLRKHFYKVDIRETDSRILGFARKGGLSRIGIQMLHFGLVITFVAGLIASLFGYSVYIWGGEGDVRRVPDRDFTIRVEGFEILYNENGQVKDYLCDLTVLKDGEEKKSKKIEVNKPLNFEGITFYQSSYRADPRQVESVTLNISRKEGENATTWSQNIPNLQTVQLEGSDYSLRIVDFAGNFQMDAGKIFSAPGINEFRNPAVKLAIFENDTALVRSGWVFTPKMAGFHNFFPDYTMELVGFDRMFETGLNARKNPGSPGIWAGLFLMTLGICLIFYVTHKRIWFVIEGGEVVVGGVANRNRSEFEEELTELIARLSNKDGAES